MKYILLIMIALLLSGCTWQKEIDGHIYITNGISIIHSESCPHIKHDGYL